MKLIKQDRSFVLVAATLITLLAVMLWGGLMLALKYLEYQSAVQDIEPRLARLRGLLLVEDRLKVASMHVMSELDGLVYTSAEDVDRLGTQMQQATRKIFVDAGMQVAGSQVLKASVLDDFTRIGVSINAEGNLPELESVLLKIRDSRPLLLIERVDIKPERRRRGNDKQELDIRIQLLSMRRNG